MTSLKRFVARIRNFAASRRGDERLREEMESHLAMQTAVNISSGMPPAEARRQAVLKFGAAESIRESYHAESSLPLIEAVLRDARYAVRKLWKSPCFAAVASGSLALAIGANTTVFSVAKQILYQRLAVPNASNLRLLAWTGTSEHVAVHHVHGDYDLLPGGLATSTVFSYPAYQQLRAENRVLGDLIAFREAGMNATIGERAERVLAEMVSENYYRVLGVQPELGRAIGAADDTVSSRPVAVISDVFWDREFGRSPAVLGESIKLNDTPVVIIGVNPQGFTGAKSTIPSETPNVIVPLALQPILTPSTDGSSWLTNPAQWWVNILRSGALAMRQFNMTLLSVFAGLALLLAAIGIYGVIAYSVTQRAHEIGVRMALGAKRRDVLQPVLNQGMVLAGLGIVFGIIGALALTRLLQGYLYRVKPTDPLTLISTCALVAIVAVLASYLPARRAASVDPLQALRCE